MKLLYLLFFTAIFCLPGETKITYYTGLDLLQPRALAKPQPLGIFDSIFTAIKNAYNTVVGFFSNIFKSIWDFFANIFNRIVSSIKKVYNSIKKIFGDIWFYITYIPKLIINAINAVIKIIKLTIDSISIAIRSIGNAFKNVMQFFVDYKNEIMKILETIKVVRQEFTAMLDALGVI